MIVIYIVSIIIASKESLSFEHTSDNQGQGKNISLRTFDPSQKAKELYDKYADPSLNVPGFSFQSFLRLLDDLNHSILHIQDHRHHEELHHSHNHEATNSHSLLNKQELENHAAGKLHNVSKHDGGRHDLPEKSAVNEINISNKCLTPKTVWASHSDELVNTSLSLASFLDLCPSIISLLLFPCHSDDAIGGLAHSREESDVDDNYFAEAWLYAFVSVIAISLCGLFGVAVIPIMQRVFYQHLLQFLIALAVGTLIGDALLHLLPHALAPMHHGKHIHDDETGDILSKEIQEERIQVFKGLVATMGVILFFCAEQLVGLTGKCRQKRSNKKRQMTAFSDDCPFNSQLVGEKLCKHGHRSRFYDDTYQDTPAEDDSNSCLEPNENDIEGNKCSKPKTPTKSRPRSLNKYDEICNESSGTINNSESQQQTNVKDGKTKSYKCSKNQKHPPMNTSPVFLTNNDFYDALMDCARKQEIEMIDTRRTSELKTNEDSDVKVIVMEHQNIHHGHSHFHGHVHSSPSSISSVAWMVILGDGLHNFCDGLAIGAAFGGSIPGGFSTSLAVFCHELPHEIGDFAMLLKTGMTAKQALIYNGLSSLLCLGGMILGLLLGAIHTFSAWLFAAAAGMFIYIALVDMLPELTSPSSTSSDSLTLRLILQISGLMLGTGIMLVIAIYEHKLEKIFE